MSPKCSNWRGGFAKNRCCLNFEFGNHPVQKQLTTCVLAVLMLLLSGYQSLSARQYAEGQSVVKIQHGVGIAQDEVLTTESHSTLPVAFSLSLVDVEEEEFDCADTLIKKGPSVLILFSKHLISSLFSLVAQTHSYSDDGRFFFPGTHCAQYLLCCVFRIW